MSKFSSPEAERLYRKEPSDQVGSSSEGIGWAGLHVYPQGGGAVIFEGTDGSVEMYEYASEDEMRAAWANFERSLEIRKPGIGDWIIWRLVPAVDEVAHLVVGPSSVTDEPSHVGQYFQKMDDAEEWVWERCDEYWYQEETTGVWILTEAKVT